MQVSCLSPDGCIAQPAVLDDNPFWDFLRILQSSCDTTRVTSRIIFAGSPNAPHTAAAAERASAADGTRDDPGDLPLVIWAADAAFFHHFTHPGYRSVVYVGPSLPITLCGIAQPCV